MPSIIEELPIKIVNVTVKGIKFCRQKLKDYQFNLQEKKREREWNIFLSQTKDWLIMLVKEQIKHDQFTYTLQPVFEEQEVIQSDGKKSVQMVHVANEIVPECVVNTKGGDFKVGCIVLGFNIFGELDSDVLLKIKEKWIHYLQKNGQYPLELTSTKGEIMSSYNVNSPPNFTRTTKHSTPNGIKEYTTEFYDNVKSLSDTFNGATDKPNE